MELRDGRASGAAAAARRSHSRLYDTEVRDEIVFASASQIAGYFSNVPRTRRQGLETRFSLLLPEDMRLFGSYTRVNATYQSTTALASALDENDVRPGDYFAMSPRHRATLGIAATRAFEAVVADATLSARGVSSSYLRGDEANEHPPLPGYVVADLRMAMQVGRLTLSTTVSNLFDRRYVVYGVYAENPKGPYGGPAPATPSVERFLRRATREWFG